MRKLAKQSVRMIWLAIGIAALALGGLGVVLPLLPTTPFLLLAAFAFAQSSQRLHDWLIAHKLFGPLIANWQQYGAISRRAKLISLLSMGAILLFSFALSVPLWLIGTQAVVLGLSGWFIATRPLPPADKCPSRSWE